MKKQNRIPGMAMMVWAICVTYTQAASPEELIRTIKSVNERGQGNVQATAALRELTKEDAAILPKILTALDDAKPLPANWLRSAFETIADRALAGGGKLSARQLERFVVDRTHNPRIRRLAFDYLVKVDDSASDRLVPGMLDDPSSELRREAVQRLIDQAGKNDPKQEFDKAIALYRKALQGATDDDLVKGIVGPLKKLGVDINLHQHFGLLTRWQAIGPFNNLNKVGFSAVYPPEKELNLEATYKGQLGEVRWQPLELTWKDSTTKEDFYGIIDIGKQIKNYKGSVMYTVTEYHSPLRQDVQIRIGTPNSWKIWVNGKLLFAREEYHRGMKLDQYKIDATLKPGKNVILLKICQNEQEQDWAQRYQFQIRICNSEGVAILQQPGNKTSQTEINNNTALTALRGK
jgi:hypothetical protein